MKSLKVAKLNIAGIKGPARIYYTIFILIVALIIGMHKVSTESGGMSGMEVSTVIFLFVSGLNSFKTNFNFAKGNNISRKTFMKGLLISVVPITLVMSIIDIVLNRIINVFIKNPTLYDQSFAGKYGGVPYDGVSVWIQSNSITNLFNTFLFHFSMCLVAYILGLVICMIFYRCNKIMKVIIAVTPVILINSFSAYSFYGNSEIVEKINEFMNFILGLDPLNVYNVVTSFLVLALGSVALSFLLVRKAAIKER